MFSLEGVLQQDTAGGWVINGIPICISDQSQVQTALEAGARVRATAIRLNPEEYLNLFLRE